MILRRLLVSVVSVAVAWVALEVWFGLREAGPTVPAGPDEGQVQRSVYEPSAEQIEAWKQRLVGMRAREGGAAGGGGATVNPFSARYGWANVPGTSGRHHDNEVSFNSLGARGSREVGEHPPEGALRVACYGESFTFGSEVDDDGTWPAQLEVAAEGSLEVINLGVSGWGTDQALLRYRDTRADLRPDVALMGLLTENIARNVNRLRPVMSRGTKLPMVKPRFVLEEGALRLIPQPYSTEVELYEAGVDGRLGIDMAPHEYWAPQPQDPGWSKVVDAVRSRRRGNRYGGWWRLWKEPEGEPFRVTIALLEAFHQEAESTGASFAGVLIFPTMADLGSEERRPDALYAALDARGIPYLALTDLLTARRARGEETYGQNHLTAEANGEVARAVLDWLEPELDR